MTTAALPYQHPRRQDPATEPQRGDRVRIIDIFQRPVYATVIHRITDSGGHDYLILHTDAGQTCERWVEDVTFHGPGRLCGTR